MSLVVVPVEPTRRNVARILCTGCPGSLVVSSRVRGLAAFAAVLESGHTCGAMVS